MPNAMVIRAPGTNCEKEMCRAFEMAGATVQTVHLDKLLREPGLIKAADLLGFPGGFSFGDDIASGRIFASKLRTRVGPHLHEAVARGVLAIGACNGFQVLAQVGLLPGSLTESGESIHLVQTATLSDNIAGRFVDRWVGMEFNAASHCVWTKGLSEGPVIRHLVQADTHLSRETLAAINQLPVAHGEGRFLTDSPATLAALERLGRVAVRYTDNYNGSENAIAGICDASGRVLGLMPHPERYLDWTRHPYWTRLPQSIRQFPTPGLQMFKNAVEAVQSSVPVASAVAS